MVTIHDISARPILDSRGSWTIEVALTLSNKVRCVASVPQGVSRGSHEALYVPPSQAVRNIEKIIAPLLRGRDPSDQEAIDRQMIAQDGTPKKSRLGGNAIIGVSMACARAGAATRGIPLWKHLRETGNFTVKKSATPRLFINLIEGGLHADHGLNFQEYLTIPKTRKLSRAITIATQVDRALKRELRGIGPVGLGDEGGFSVALKNDIAPFEMMSRILKRLGLHDSVSFGLDAAAQNVRLSTSGLLRLYETMNRRFNLTYLEDPFPETDFTHFAGLRKKIGRDTLIAGDDLTVTNLARMATAHDQGSINAIVIKPNQIGTVSEALVAVKTARENRWAVVVSHRGGETNDDFIADFAYGVGADGFKLGAPARGERIAKYNRLLEIEKVAE